MGIPARHCCIAILLVGLHTAPSVSAFDRAKTAVTMAAQAAAAYKAGSFLRAAQLYFEAWTTDPSQPNYLWAAARAEHLGGQFDKALLHYQQFAATPGADPEKTSKTMVYADGVRGLQVDAKVQEAERAKASGNLRLAAQLYLEACQDAPDRPELLFMAASCELAIGDNINAGAHLREYLQKAPAQARDRAAAQARLQTLEPAEAPEPSPNDFKLTAEPKPAVAPPTPAVVVPAKAPDVPLTRRATATPDRKLGWTVTAGGAALLAAGAGLWWATNTDVAAFDAADADTNTGGKIVSSPYDTQHAAWESIHARQVTAVTLASVGLITAAVGAWLLERAPAQVTVTRGPGVTLALRF